MIDTAVHQLNSSEFDTLEKKNKAEISVKIADMRDFSFIHVVAESDDFKKWCSSDFWDNYTPMYKNELEAASSVNYKFEEEDHILIGCVNSKRAAIFIGRWLMEGVVQIHIFILPRYRRFTLQLCKAVIKWSQDNTDTEGLVAEVPEYNLPAFSLAKRLGFRLVNYSDRVIEKSGKMWRLYLFGIRIGGKKNG